MRAPDIPTGQGARYQCPGCGRPLVVSPTGRTQKFCSGQCRDEARRGRNFRDFGTTVPRRSDVPRNPLFSSANSVACKGTSAGRALPIFAVGLGLSTAPDPKPEGEWARQIHEAVQYEMRARWPRMGLKWGRS
jgi:hypothetical protein